MRLSIYIPMALSLLLPSCGSPATKADHNLSPSLPQSCIKTDNASRVSLIGGNFAMGSEDFYPDEAPVRPQSVAPFAMDTYEVTRRQFKTFVDATGYITVAERTPDPDLHPDISKNDLVAGSAVFDMKIRDSGLGVWRFIPGANWHSPEGPETDIEGAMDFPVTHIAYEDANAYAKWVDGDLPTEAQWEFAARGGLESATFEWGETAPEDTPIPKANTWQGIFPVINKAVDGHLGAAPVGCYEPNGYGLYDMTGNVWEWIKDSDPKKNAGTVKGGSFLCAENYCQRYRPSGRHLQELDFSTNHIGFRVAYSVKGFDG